MSFLSKHKTAFVVSITAISLVLIVYSNSDLYKPSFIGNSIGYIVTPMQNIIGNIGSFVHDKIDLIAEINAIEVEIEELREENLLLKAELKRFNLIEEENKKLSDLLELGYKYVELPKVGANVKVIGENISNWYGTFLINKGSSDGLEKNMVVLAAEGLVGVIIESFSNYSKVAPLIDDDANAIASQSIRTNTLGFIRGDASLMLEGLCRMEHIDIDADIVPGDVIITSSLGHIYPAGITIGYVEEVIIDNDNLTKYAIIKPAVDFERLETVSIVNEVYTDDFTEEAKN